MNCPVCGEKLVVEYEYHEGHAVSETATHCPAVVIDEKFNIKDHYYSYQYAYGSWEETIGGVVFHGHYTDSDEYRAARAKVIEAAVELEKLSRLNNRKSRGLDVTS